jgi:hypothetical protein
MRLDAPLVPKRGVREPIFCLSFMALAPPGQARQTRLADEGETYRGPTSRAAKPPMPLIVAASSRP